MRATQVEISSSLAWLTIKKRTASAYFTAAELQDALKHDQLACREVLSSRFVHKERDGGYRFDERALHALFCEVNPRANPYGLWQAVRCMGLPIYGPMPRRRKP